MTPRPGGERDAAWSSEQRTRIINRFKSTLAWFGIRGFKPHVCAMRRHGSRRCEPSKEMPLPANTMAELRREIVRLRLIVEQIREIEAGRAHRWSSSRGRRPPRWSAPWRKFAASASRPQTCLPTRRSQRRPLRDQRRGGAGSLSSAGQRPDPGAVSTGSPGREKRGSLRREKGLARASPLASEQGRGNARVRLAD